MPDAAPIPISALYDPVTFLCQITFNQPLQAGISAQGNWTINYNLFTAPAQAGATILGNTVTYLKSGFDMPTGLPNRAIFSDTVHDLFGANGLPVQAFSTPYTIVI